MKLPINIFTLLALCAVSCAAQPAAKPATPARPATPAKPAEPAEPAEPAVPRTPVPPSAAALKDAADQVKIAADQVAIAKFNLGVADPFNERDDPNRTLVLLRDTGEAKNQSDTEEDLNVMARILEKASASRDERNARAFGISYRSPFGSSPSLRNLYLEGYGAIFFFNVNYSLTPPPAKTDDSDAKEERDSEWDEARRELSSPGGRAEFPAQQFGVETKSHPMPEYDADKVETLQKNLAQALKNAVHIRTLKADETVTIVVNGRGPAGPLKPKPVGRTRRTNSSTAGTAASTREKLIIRAKKSDIEAFQSDKLTLEAFRQRLTISLS